MHLLSTCIQREQTLTAHITRRGLMNKIKQRIIARKDRSEIIKTAMRIKLTMRAQPLTAI